MSITVDHEATVASSPSRRLLRIRPERLKELSLAGVIFVAIVIFSFLVDDYMSGRFFNRVTTSVAITAVLAAGQTLVIITRNVDLSVGSIVGVTAYVTGEVVGAHPGTPAVVAVVMAMAIGCLLGLINGVLVAYGGVPAIIVTLGTLAIYRTWLIDHANAKTITADSLPGWLVQLPQKTVASFGDLDLRLVFVVAVVVVVLLQWSLARLRWGRQLYAVGSNPEAAEQGGLPRQRLVLLAFAGSGTLAGLGGFLFLARFGTITVAAGQGLELQSIAGAVVGGVSIGGGSGTLFGALLGALLIDLLNQSLARVPQISEFWRDAILGTLILLAATGDALLSRRFQRLLAGESRPRAARWQPATPGRPAADA
jgi:rhamnose transport system permease protein